ncbi:MAG: hypothetical protein ACOCUT_00010 [bacterium]
MNVQKSYEKACKGNHHFTVEESTWTQKDKTSYMVCFIACDGYHVVFSSLSKKQAEKVCKEFNKANSVEECEELKKKYYEIETHQ